MDTAQIESLVRRAVSGEIAQNWTFYALMLAVVVVGVALVAFAAPYLQARGKAYATKADFDELLSQLQKTTEATERIKADVSHQDWKLRERNTLRREKLEELLVAVHECHDWLDKRQKWWYTEDDTSGQSPVHKVSVVARLYFPELREPVQFALAVGKMNQFIINEKSNLLHAKWKANDQKDASIYQKAMDTAVSGYRPNLERLVEATSRLEEEACGLMRQIM